MQPDEIIKQFNVYVDDTSELSSEEEYTLLTKTLNSIYNDRSWEFLRKTATVTTTTATTAPLPSDFVSVMNNYSNDEWNNMPEKAIVYVGGIPYEFIPAGMATQKAGGAYVYIDIRNKLLTFTTSIGAGQVCTFDYKYQPDAITSNSSDIALPSTVRHYLGQVMSIDDDVIQKTEKARSNYQANSIARAQLIRDLAHYELRFLNY